VFEQLSNWENVKFTLNQPRLLTEIYGIATKLHLLTENLIQPLNDSLEQASQIVARNTSPSLERVLILIRAVILWYKK
jgi:hypothetical protein